MTQPLLGASLCLCLASGLHAQTVLYEESFDGSTGYNPDASTALVGENDWVDFGDRLTDSLTDNEGYTTADGSTETVLTGEPTHNDPQIRTDFSPNIPKALVGDTVLRIRADMNNDGFYDASDTMVAADVSLFYTVSPYGNPGATNGPGPNSFGTPVVTAQSDGWHLFTWPDPGGLSAGGAAPNIEGFRLDPLNNKIDISYEIDSLTLYETANPPPTVEIDPASPVGSEFTLRQEWNWNADDDLEGWTSVNFDVPTPNNGTEGVIGGVVTGVSTSGDPQFTSPAFEVADVESGRFVIEIGMVSEPGDATPRQLFYATGGGGFSGAQSVTIVPPAGDGNLQVYRITFDDDINSTLTRVRLDPSNALSVTSNIDYVRIYSEGPEIVPPMAELDPGPLGSEFTLAQEWTWKTEDDLEGWIPENLTVPVPNDGFEGVYGGSLWGFSLNGDPRLLSPGISLPEPPSGRVVVEIDYNGGSDEMTAGGTIFWSLNGDPYAADRRLTLPVVPSDGNPHTIRVIFEDDLPGTLTGLRIDPVNETELVVGLDAVRIYRDLTGASDYDTWTTAQAWTPGAPNTAPGEDFDGDGIDNDTERLFGLVPTDGSSSNAILTTLSTDGSFTYQRRDPALSGATYRIYTSTDLVTWTEDTGAGEMVTAGDVQTVEVTLSATPVDGRLFVRVEAE